MKGTGGCNGVEMIDLWVGEENGTEGPGVGYNSVCEPDHNRTSGIGCKYPTVLLLLVAPGSIKLGHAFTGHQMHASNAF